MTERRAAHDQLVVHEEGRDDGHPEADALVHVQLTCGLACYSVDHLFHHAKRQEAILSVGRSAQRSANDVE
jgi:hypothetical protein